MKLPEGLTAPQIRILQEFRRIGAEEMEKTEVEGIQHPSVGGAEAVQGLIERGYLESLEDGKFRLSAVGKEFLSWIPEPEKDRWS